MQVEWIVVHCSDAPPKYGAADIRAWHLDQGWSDIGYHRVISKPDDHWFTELGRNEAVPGSHAYGLNSRSLGICVAGKYDDEAPEQSPWDLAARICAMWCMEYGLNSERVIGHREVDRAGAPKTLKTCPGKMFDMDSFRDEVRTVVDLLERLEPA